MQKKTVKTQDVVVMYTEHLLTLRQIATITGMTHAGVSKRLKKAGVMNSSVTCNCDFCGKEITKVRSRYKATRQHFCNADCHAAAIASPGYKPWRQGCRLARAIVSQYFQLSSDNIVHHIDGDNRNNNLSNLMVFANQSDHLKFHRGGNVLPIWDGRTIRTS